MAHRRSSFGVILVAILGFGEGAARADQMAGSPVPTLSFPGGPAPVAPRDLERFPYLDRETSQDCGQSCMYEKGNENLTAQALNSVKVFQEAEALRKVWTDTSTGGDPVQKEQDRKRAFTAMARLINRACPELRDQVANGGSLDPNENGNDRTLGECYLRYQVTTVAQLRKIYSSMSGNSGEAAALRNGFDGGTAAAVISQVDPASGPRLRSPQVTYMPTREDLAREYAEDARNLERTAGLEAEYERFAKGSDAFHRPEETDFVVTRDMPRNPNDPSAGTITVVEQGPDKKPKIKDKEYRAALLAWENGRKGEQGASLRAAAAAAKGQRAQKKFEDEILDTEAGVFDRARGVIVATMNKSLDQKGVAKAGRQRAPSSAVASRRGGGTGGAAGRVSGDINAAGGDNANGTEQVYALAPSNGKDFYTVTFGAEDLWAAIQRIEKIPRLP